MCSECDVSTGYKSTNSEGEAWGIWGDVGDYWRVLEYWGNWGFGMLEILSSASEYLVSVDVY